MDTYLYTRSRRVLALLLTYCLGTWAAFAEVVLDGSLAPCPRSCELAGPDYLIDPRYGTTNGTNLFHSFRDFNINLSESATFIGPDRVDNIFARVTGGNSSFINGTLGVKSNDPSVNLWFINPAGIMFGAGARLDISGSFYATTADYLVFGKDGRFDASNPRDTVLSVSTPSAFGFLDSNIASISVQQGGSLSVPVGETISFVAGDINLTGQGHMVSNLVLLGNSIDMFDFSNVPAVLNASSGKIDLISLASAGEVSITDTGYDLSTIDQLGDISMDYGAVISTQGDPGGTIYIRAGNFVMENSYLDSSTVGIKDHSGIGIDIQVSNEFLVHTGIGTSNIGDKPVLFRQAALSNTNDQLVGGSAISSSTANDGQAGNIIIEAGLLDIDGVGVGYSSSAGNSGIVSRVFGTGNSGDINIKADTISLNESSMIATQAFSESSGNSGDIRIDVKDIRLNGVNGSSIISTSTQGSGNAGNLFIFSDHLLARGGVGTTQISSSADGGQKSFSHSGNVNISASKIELYDGAEIGADLFSGAGQGGDVIIKADTIDISGRDKDGYSAGVYSTVSGNETSGQGGNVFIQSQELYMDNYALVGVFNRPGSMGNSGSIDIKTDNLALTNGSIISGSAFGSGRGGDINIYANSIYLSGPSPYTEFTDDFFGEFTGIFTVAALEGGDAGNININAGSIDILDGAQINSQTGGRGQGGNININADRIFVSGYDPLSDSISRISASTEVYQDYARASGGDGGSLTITANTIELQDQGLITTRSTTTGDGGSLTISTGSLSLSSGAAISADSTNTGNAGTININASEIVSLSDSEITSRAEQSTAGSVSVHANQIEMYRASILASSAGNEAAGNINLAAFDSFVMEQSRITSEAQSANGGNIDILVNNTMRVTDSFITASVQGGNGNGGNIFIEPGFMIVDNSQITADAHGGDGGKVTIIAKSFIASANSNISASSELGISGNVTIDAPNRDLSAELAILPDSIIDVASLFRNDCAAVGSKYSSFIIKDSEQVSVSLLSPSFYVADSDSQETISDSYMADNSLLRTALNTDKSGGCGQSSVVF